MGDARDRIHNPDSEAEEMNQRDIRFAYAIWSSAIILMLVYALGRFGIMAGALVLTVQFCITVVFVTNQKKVYKDILVNVFRPLGRYLGNAILVCLLVAFLFDGLDAGWRWNILWDIVYASDNGPILPGTHASVILAVCVTAIFLIVRGNFREIGLPILVVLSTAAIHEIWVGISDFILGGWPLLTLAESPLYIIYVGFFALTGYALANQYQKKVLSLAWFIAAILLLLTVIVNVNNIPLSPTSPNVIDGLPVHLTLEQNLIELGTWLGPLSLWFIPPRYIERLKL